MEKADLLLWVLDGRENLTSIDWELASRLRRIKSPVIIVINKREGMTSEAPPAEFSLVLNLLYKFLLTEMVSDNFAKQLLS